MPVGLGFQRKHRKLGYKLKYFYYLVKRRDLLQKKASFGEKNPDKIFYIVKPDYQDEVEGLLSLIYRQILYIKYATKKGYVPFVDWKNYKTQYFDGVNNVWEYFFMQPSNFNLEEVYKSKNIFFSGWTYNDINPNGLFSVQVFFDTNMRNECSQLFKKYLSFSNEVSSLVKEEMKLLNVEECIGVYVRGTDYVKLRPSGEYIQPTVEQVIPVIKTYLKKYPDKEIFLVTEDGLIYDSLKAEFAEKIRIVSFDSFIREYSGGKVLSKSDILSADRKKRGQNYLVKMILLSKCRYLISSVTQGSKFSYILNDGKYEDQYIFDLGLYS